MLCYSLLHKLRELNELYNMATIDSLAFGVTVRSLSASDNSLKEMSSFIRWNNETTYNLQSSLNDCR